MRAVVGVSVSGRGAPEAGEDLELLLEPGESFLDRWERQAVRPVLRLVPAGPDAEFDPPAGHLVGLRDLDRQ